MRNALLTEYELVDVRRLVNTFTTTPLYEQRRAAEVLVERIGEIYDNARSRQIKESVA